MKITYEGLVKILKMRDSKWNIDEVLNSAIILVLKDKDKNFIPEPLGQRTNFYSAILPQDNSTNEQNPYFFNIKDAYIAKNDDSDGTHRRGFTGRAEIDIEKETIKITISAYGTNLKDVLS